MTGPMDDPIMTHSFSIVALDILKDKSKAGSALPELSTAFVLNVAEVAQMF